MTRASAAGKTPVITITRRARASSSVARRVSSPASAIPVRAPIQLTANSAKRCPNTVARGSAARGYPGKKR
jgi:hypothetical protein